MRYTVSVHLTYGGSSTIRKKLLKNGFEIFIYDELSNEYSIYNEKVTYKGISTKRFLCTYKGETPPAQELLKSIDSEKSLIKYTIDKRVG